MAQRVSRRVAARKPQAGVFISNVQSLSPRTGPSHPPSMLAGQLLRNVDMTVTRAIRWLHDHSLGLKRSDDKRQRPLGAIQ